MMPLPTLLDNIFPKSVTTIPDVITLTREQVLGLDRHCQWEFCTRVLGLVLLKGRDITVNYAGYREVFKLKEAQEGRIALHSLDINTIIQKIKNGGKTDCQIAVEEAARKIADILTREYLA